MDMILVVQFWVISPKLLESYGIVHLWDSLSGCYVYLVILLIYLDFLFGGGRTMRGKSSFVYVYYYGVEAKS